MKAGLIMSEESCFQQRGAGNTCGLLILRYTDYGGYSEIGKGSVAQGRAFQAEREPTVMEEE